MDSYTYLPNTAAGHFAQLDQIALGAGGTMSFTYDAAGNQTQVDAAGDAVDRAYDDAGRMSRQERTAAITSTDFRYDGRSYLRQAAGIAPDATGTAGVFCDGFETGDTFAWDTGVGPCPTTDILILSDPTYSSEGVLHRIAAPGQSSYVFYFDDRPVAQLASNELLIYLSTDHLGTPILATDEAGNVEWQDGFEPFGADYSGASAAGVFLRFPGQWADVAWAVSGLEITALYNVHRWIEPRTGRHTRPDPLGINDDDFTLYAYGIQNPSINIDPLGLLSLAPGNTCKKFHTVIRKLQKLKKRCDCVNFFSDMFDADLKELIDGPLPLLKVEDGPGDASTPCERDPGVIRVDPKWCRFTFRGDLDNIILHELGHYADCKKQNFPIGGSVEEGAEAERACFGVSRDAKVMPDK